MHRCGGFPLVKVYEKSSFSSNLTVRNMQSSTNTDKKYFVGNVNVMFESIVNICTTANLSPNQLEENFFYWFNYKH